MSPPSIHHKHVQLVAPWEIVTDIGFILLSLCHDRSLCIVVDAISTIVILTNRKHSIIFYMVCNLRSYMWVSCHDRHISFINASVN